MSDKAYTAVRSGSLKFKGQKKIKKKKKKISSDASSESGDKVETRHNAFWLVTSTDHLVGNVLVETQSGGYLTAIDDGTVTTALPRPADHSPENMPEPQDIMTIVKVSDTRVAFKTAYGRYISSVPDSGDVVAQTEAMGVREMWQPIMQSDGIIQFRSPDKKFLCASVPGQLAHAHSDSPSAQGVLFRIHSSGDIAVTKPKKRGDYDIDGGSLKNMETNFVKKFQSYQNLCFKEGSKVKVSAEDRKRLKSAKTSGKLHEELLDRRSKLKADRYCK
eukprot:m.10213 g.10213  ORF g.10213 m.10213 type:complete len:275 (+) comp7256_c0_seq1:271-1095(+)